MNLHLFHYWRSSASWRVRWALNLKKINCPYTHVSIIDGESEQPAHLARNPLGYVPVLQVGDQYLCESMAILHWLDETFPLVPLLPEDAMERAHVRMLSEIINASTQPLQNLNPLHFLSPDPAVQKNWAQHWIRRGLGAYETLAKPTAGKFSFGDEITLTDLFLIPQCYASRRQEVDLEEFPTIAKIWKNAMATEECKAAQPENFEPRSA